jgi:hypothetical protein
VAPRPIQAAVQTARMTGTMGRFTRPVSTSTAAAITSMIGVS